MNLGLWLFADDLAVGFLNMQGPPNRLYAPNMDSHPDPEPFKRAHQARFCHWDPAGESRLPDRIPPRASVSAPILCLPQGPVASTASAFSVLSSGPGLPPPPPPPPPPGPPPLFENEGKNEESSPSRSALFAQLNQGEAITKGKKTNPPSKLLPSRAGSKLVESPGPQ